MTLEVDLEAESLIAEYGPGAVEVARNRVRVAEAGDDRRAHDRALMVLTKVEALHVSVSAAPLTHTSFLRRKSVAYLSFSK